MPSVAVIPELYYDCYRFNECFTHASNTAPLSCGEESVAGDEEFEDKTGWKTPATLADGPSKRDSTQAAPAGVKRSCNFSVSNP